MKKITFILIALISGTAFAQNSAQGSSEVGAEIVQPISITLTEGTSLDFGKFTTPTTGTGTVTITPAGDDRSFTAAEMEITAFANFGVPTFTVTRDATVSPSYNIELAVVTNPTDGANIMTLTNLQHSLATSTGLTASTFTVGGDLQVPAGQPAGLYSGEISVTVTYE